MKFHASYPPHRLDGVRLFDLILLAFLLVMAVIFMLFPAEWFFQVRHMRPQGTERVLRSPLRETAVPKKIVITLNDILPGTGSPIIQGPAKTDPEKLDYRVGFEDATGGRVVRVAKLKVGVDYKVFPNNSLGVEASRGIHDPNDAAAWDESVKDENAAKVKYKVLF